MNKMIVFVSACILIFITGVEYRYGNGWTLVMGIGCLLGGIALTLVVQDKYDDKT